VSFVFPLLPDLQAVQHLIIAAYPAAMILILGALLVVASRNVASPAVRAVSVVSFFRTTQHSHFSTLVGEEI
jgi:hypothetical protein